MTSFFKHNSKFYILLILDQLNQIFDTTLSSILCKNSDSVEYSQRYVMKRVTNTNPLVKCENMDTFNFEPWREMNSNYKLHTINFNSDESEVHILKKRNN